MRTSCVILALTHLSTLPAAAAINDSVYKKEAANIAVFFKLANFALFQLYTVLVLA